MQGEAMAAPQVGATSWGAAGFVLAASTGPSAIWALVWLPGTRIRNERPLAGT